MNTIITKRFVLFIHGALAAVVLAASANAQGIEVVRKDSVPPTRAQAVTVMQKAMSAIKRDDTRSGFKLFHRAPEWKKKRFENHVYAFMENFIDDHSHAMGGCDVSAIEELVRDGIWGPAIGMIDKDRLRRRAALHLVKPDACYALALKDGRTEAVLHWDGNKFTILHYEDAARRKLLQEDYIEDCLSQIRIGKAPTGVAMSFYALGRLGPDAEAAIPTLSKLLTNDDAEMRVQAAITLWRIDRKVEISLPPILAVLTDKEIRASSRTMAADCLWIIGPDAKSAAPDLTAAMGEEDLKLRTVSAAALWKIAGDSDSTTPILIESLKGEDLNASSAAGRTLAEIISTLREDLARKAIAEQLTLQILEIATSKEVRIRIAAIRALAQIEVKNPSVNEALKKALEDENVKIRFNAAKAVKDHARRMKREGGETEEAPGRVPEKPVPEKKNEKSLNPYGAPRNPSPYTPLRGKMDAKAADAERKRMPPPILIDEFDGKLGLKWKIHNSDPTHVSLTKKPGALTITTQEGGINDKVNNARNLFLVANPIKQGGNYTVTVCLDAFRPKSQWNQAGLLLFNDVDNYLKCDYEISNKRGTRLALLAVTNGKTVSKEKAFSAKGGRVWLRVTKRRNNFSAFYSDDGIKFSKFAELWWKIGEGKWLGLYAKNGAGVTAPEIDASFDYFEMREPARENMPTIDPVPGQNIDKEKGAVAWLPSKDPFVGERLNPGFSNLNGFAYSPDGATLAIFGWDEKDGKKKNVIQLLSSNTGRVKSICNLGENDEVKSVAFSPDGKSLVAALQIDVLVWDLKSGRAFVLPRLYESPNDLRSPSWPHAVTFSKSGRLLAVARSSSVEILDFATRRRLALIKAGQAGVAFSPDERILATAEHNNRIHLWDVKTGKQLAEDHAHMGIMRAVAFSLDGKTLVAGGGGIKRWGVGREGERAVLTSPVRLAGMLSSVRDMHLSPDGELLASCGGKVIKVWDTRNYDQKITLRVAMPGSHAMAVSFSPDGKSLVVAGAGREDKIFRKFLKRWNVREITKPGTLEPRVRRAARDLVKALKAGRESNRHYASTVSASMAIIAGSEIAVPILLKEFNNPNVNVREGIVFALMVTGPKSPAVIGALKKTLQDESSEVAERAAWVLTRIDPKRFSKERLWVILQDRKPPVVVKKDGRMYYDGRSLESWIYLLGKHHAPNEIYGRSPRRKPAAAIRAFGRDALPVVLRLLKSESEVNTYSRWGAIDALGVLGAESIDVVDTLLPFMEEKKWTVSEVAAKSMGKILRDADSKQEPLSESAQKSRAAVKAHRPKLKHILAQKKHPEARKRIQDLIDYLEAGPPPQAKESVATQEVKAGFLRLSKRLAKTGNYSFQWSRQERGKAREEGIRGSFAREDGVGWQVLEVREGANTYHLVVKNKKGAIKLGQDWLTVADIVSAKEKQEIEALRTPLEFIQGCPSFIEEATRDIAKVDDFSRKGNRHVAVWSKETLKQRGHKSGEFWVEMKDGVPVKWGDSMMRDGAEKNKFTDSVFVIEKMGTTQLKIPAAARERLKKPQVPPDWLK